MSRPSSFWHDPAPFSYLRNEPEERTKSSASWLKSESNAQLPQYRRETRLASASAPEPGYSAQGADVSLRASNDGGTDETQPQSDVPDPVESAARVTPVDEEISVTGPLDLDRLTGIGGGDLRSAPIDAIQPRAVWQKALGELQLQLAHSTYTTWLRDTWVEAYEDGEFIVGTPNTYARDWLQNRLRNLVRKTLKGIVGRTVEVQFIVRPVEVKDRVDFTPAPLYTRPDEIAHASGIMEPEGAMATPTQPQPQDRRASDESSTRRSSRHTVLNKGYTFDSYIVGNNNRFACAAAQAVAERPGYRFNPLFVHGGVGLGKTHLLHAIGNQLQDRDFQVLYCSSEQFTNELISAIRSQNTESFRNKYRELDALLIDDIQFIAGKESTQEEFFHTFNHLQSLGKQIVVSCDRPPKALQSLEERLRSRFEGGIQVDVSAPDFETRVAILQSKAARMGIVIGLDVLKLLAERVDSNIRELEGALNHLFLQAQMSQSPLNMTLAVDTLNNVAPQRKPCSPPRLLELVAANHGLTVDDLTGQRRTRPLADARHVAMYLLREDLALSLPVIGQWLGGRDHTTVAHAVDKITTELRSDEELRRRVAVLRERIYAPFAG